MGKNIIIFCLFVILTVHTSAQDFNGGVIAGINLSEISGDFVDGPNKLGLYLGLFTNRYVSDRSSIQLELNYVQKGSTKSPDSINYSYYNLRLHYIELHLMYKFDIKKFTLEIGPSFGYLAKSYEEADGWEVDDPFNTWDFSLGFGLNYKISKNLSANLRYSNTVYPPVRNNPSGNTFFLRKGQYNEVLSLTLHYTFFHARN